MVASEPEIHLEIMWFICLQYFFKVFLFKCFSTKIQSWGSSLNHVATKGGRGGCEIDHVCPCGREGGFVKSTCVQFAFFLKKKWKYIMVYIHSIEV